MVRIEGYFINLNKARTRRKRMEEHLQQLPWGKCYKRFSAETSNTAEAEQRGLTAGEYGLWKSWIKLLEQTVRNSNLNEYDYLHILEDDAILNKDLIKILDQLNPTQHGIEILTTEMYVNEEIWNALAPQWQKQRKKQSTGMLLKYTGCLSSTLIPSKSIEKVLAKLREEYLKSRILHPIDNTIVRLEHEKLLKVACTLPFLSHVEHNSIAESNIQSFDNNSTNIILTQEINCLLRKQLSWERNKEDFGNLIKMLLELADLGNNREYENMLLKAALNLAKTDNLFRYKYDPRLRNAPNNPQNSNKSWPENKNNIKEKEATNK